MKYLRLFEDFEPHDPYELMMIPPNKKAEMILDEFMNVEPNLNLINDLIVLGANVNWQDGHHGNRTPLHFAVRNELTKIARMLIDAGIDVNLQDEDGQTPLHMAVVRRNVKIVRMLIDAGADVNRQTKKGSTPLHRAAEFGKVEFAIMLIDAGADVNMQNRNGETPLHVAIIHHNQVEPSRILIDAGADVNVQDNWDWTPLHWAARNGRVEVAQMLIDAGARKDISNIAGKFPYELTTNQELKNMLKP